MRVNVIQGDPGYRDDAVLFKPYLNGVLVKGCFTADEEAGEMWCYRLNPDGSFNTDRRGKPVVQRRRGEVRLIGKGD